MQEFCRLTFELFPVEGLRVNLIKCYFKKSQNDPEFIKEHPLQSLSFQFMICLKTINRLIKDKEMGPLKLPSAERISKTANPNNLFLKYTLDYHYAALILSLIHI